MRSVVLAIALCWSGTPALAQEAPIPTRILSSDELRSRPPIAPLVSASMAAGVRHFATSVTLVYDAQGNVTHLRLEAPTPSKTLDAAILAWATGLKIRTRQPGIGTVPITIDGF